MALYAIGTPVVDYFAKVDAGFLRENRLVLGATNLMPRRKVDKIAKKLGKKIFLVAAGDNARNVCEGFCFLGSSASYEGVIGNDAEGKMFARNLLEKGITPLLQKKKGNSGKIIALITPDGQRTFAVNLGETLGLVKFDRKALLQASAFYVASITLFGKSALAKTAKEAFLYAKKQGVLTALSLESPPMVKKERKKLLLLAKYADVLFLNEDELEALIGKKGVEGEEKIALLLPNAKIFLKKGEAGSLVICGKSRFIVPKYAAKAKDTTGAGDAYAAGALYGLCHGYSCEQAARLGSHLAASVVGQFGAGVPKGAKRLVI
jgi:sugar/nucleoside kinase (ribokinase family)